MTASLDRRAALAALGASGAATAFPRTLRAASPHPWLATPAQIAAERTVLELLEDPAVKRLQAKLRGELGASPRARAIPDAARKVDEALSQWTNSLIFAELAKDTARPAFLWGTDDTPREWLGHRLGGVGTSGDNPDAIYRTAGIEGGGRYEIIGQYHRESRPTQVLIEVHNTDIARPHTMMAPVAGGKAPDPQAQTQIDQDQFVVDRDGRFRITLGGEADGPNHLPLPASGFCTVGVRDILSDWRLRACGLSIRRLDKVAAAPFGIAQVRELVLRDLEGYVAFWSRFPDIWFGGLKPNAHSQPQQRPGGWGFVAGLNFHLRPDEALVVTTSPGGARYTGVQLTDPWMIASDARQHQVSLNISQATPNADGTVTYVIAASDPGAANWLDTAGCHDGLGIIRWQAVPPGLTGQGLLHEVRVIKLGEVARLPGLPRVTPAERLARLAARKADYETRTR
jgi:hypothetical protein